MLICLSFYLLGIGDASSQDWNQWGGSSLRNSTSSAINIPASWNVEKFVRKTGEWISDEAENIKWVAKLGSQTYGQPIVADGRIFVGTNNDSGYLKRYPSHVDLGCLLCFRESDGKFLWQYSSEKLATGRVHDWPMQGIVSAPLVEGNRLWFVNNRGEIVCADTEGFYDDEDDGPQQDVRRRLFSTDATITSEGIHHRYNLSPGRTSLRAAVESMGLSLPRSCRFQALPEGVFLIVTGTRYNSKLIGRLAFADDFLRVSRPIELDGQTSFQEIGTVPRDLVSGLDEGIVGSTVRALFLRHGTPLPQELVALNTAPDETWSISAKIDGTVEQFELCVEGKRLVAYHLQPTDNRREADVVWSFDMMSKLGVRQHNLATCCVTSWGDTLFVCTSNGVDETHITIPAPEAPSFIAMDKRTGRLLWTDNSPGINILHGQWSAPVVGELGGVPQVIFPGGDGWVYSFRADRWKDGLPELLWKFDANPKESKWTLGGRGTRNNLVAIPVIYDGLVYFPVGQEPEHGEGPGHMWCIDPTKRGDVSSQLVVDAEGNKLPHFRHDASAAWGRILELDQKFWDELAEGPVSQPLRGHFERVGFKLPPGVAVKKRDRRWMIEASIDGVTKRFRLIHSPWQKRLIVELETNSHVVPNPNSAVVWHFENEDTNGDGEIQFEEQFHRGIASVAIKNDLLFVCGLSGLVHCMNAKTGDVHWTYDLLAGCWVTPLIVDGKVYIGDEDGDVVIFQLSADPTKSFKKISYTARNGKKGWNYEAHQEIFMNSSIYSTPIVANGVLYIADRSRLYAIAKPEQ